ncbi:MAG: heparinase II/III family protein [Chloroflexota bacterium]
MLFYLHLAQFSREGREGLVKPGLLPEAWLDFVWFDPSVEMKPLEGMDKTAVFPDMGLLTTRSSWQADATYIAFKCGTPNGARGWQLGQAINRKNNWDVIKASHEHPDENSFILMRGDDYLTVDPGYSRDKLTRNHSTLLVDGQGQYNEGGYNAFEGLSNAFAGLDQAWGGRLQEWFTASGRTYVQGEAAGAYAAELGLTQYSRQMLMLDADTIVVCDDIRLTTPRKLEWLLQTDHAAQQVGEQAWRISAETHALRVDALEPQAIAADRWEQEISANPTSAKPDWIITRHQHTLVLSPAQPTTQARYFVILSFAEPSIKQLDCQFGSAAQIGSTLVAFASGRHHMRIVDRLTTDAAWCAINGSLITVGNATNLWQNGSLKLLASSPSDIALTANGCTVSAKRPLWISCAVAKQPRSVQIDGKEIETRYNAELGLLRFQVPAGQVRVDWHY